MKISFLLFAGWTSLSSFSACQLRENIPARDLIIKLEDYFESIADSGFAFSVLISKDSGIFFKKGYGWINSSETIPASEKTVYNIASITKSFTAACFFILQEKNLLNLSDSIFRFFPDAPEDKRSITISQLLTHASGLGQNYLSDGIKDRDAAVKAIFSDDLQFNPGTNFSYSNENYELLGALIEIISGQTYEEFIRGNILMKAGMNSTFFWSETSRIDSNMLAVKNRILNQSITGRNWGYIGSGGIYTTAADLYNWFKSLAEYKIMSRKSLQSMWSPQISLDDTKIAYGWFISDTPWGKEIWTRGTEDWGHNAVLRWFPEKKTLIIVMSNSGEIGSKNMTANRFISDNIIEIIFK